jgi:prepilin-type N-terminal cleavage/methylation domain-containing protein
LPRPAFTLVELLVVVSIILILMGMIGSAVSAARTSQKNQATQALIAKIDGVIQQHYSSFASRVVPGATSAADRAAKLRTLASAEMPDNWGLVGGTATPPQAAYASVRTSIPTITTGTYGDAECLFMIVMQGGVADCLDCEALGTSQKGDLDTDGAPEFLDAWGQPIRYVLWPSALKLPPSWTTFFSSSAPFSAGTPAVAPGGTMRPLIYSGGPAKSLGPTVPNDGNNVVDGFITNFDAEVAK